MRYLLFWDITRRRFVVIYRRFGTIGTSVNNYQSSLRNTPEERRSIIYIDIYTGRFIMFSVITNIYSKKTKGPTLMEFFTATEKLKIFFLLTTRDVRCMHQG